MSPTASQPIVTAPGGREPIASPNGGAPPGAPTEGPPFQSALETEWARTAIAEGQQQSHSQNTPPADGEPASTAEAFDRLPHGSKQPTRRHSGHRTTPLPADAKATAGCAPSAPTPAGPTPTLATALPTATAAGELAVGATGGPAAGASTGPATAGTGSPTTGAEGTPNSGAPPARGASSASAEGALTAAAVAHEDALLSSPTSPPATAHDGASTTGASAIPGDSAPIAGGSALGYSTAGGDALGYSTPAAPLTGALATPHNPSAPSAGTSAGALATTLNPSTSSTGGTSTSGGGSSNAGGGGNPTHADANRAAGQGRLHDASDAGAHDKLWVADPGQASTDGGAAGGAPPRAGFPKIRPPR